MLLLVEDTLPSLHSRTLSENKQLFRRLKSNIDSLTKCYPTLNLPISTDFDPTHALPNEYAGNLYSDVSLDAS